MGVNNHGIMLQLHLKKLHVAIFFPQNVRESLTCGDTRQVNEMTQLTCFIGNPLAGRKRVLVSTTIIPRIITSGNLGDLIVDFNVNSVNDEMQGTIDDGSNSATGRLSVNYVADVMLDSPGYIIIIT